MLHCKLYVVNVTWSRNNDAVCTEMLATVNKFVYVLGVVGTWWMTVSKPYMKLQELKIVSDSLWGKKMGILTVTRNINLLFLTIKCCNAISAQGMVMRNHFKEGCVGWYQNMKTQISVTDWLTNSTVHSFSCEAKSSSASQDIHRISWKEKVHHHAHKSLSLVHIMSHMNEVHAHPSCWF